MKSLMPYPAIPNDTDIIHLGGTEGYKRALAAMRQAGYIQVDWPGGSGWKAGSGPSVEMFHDGRTGDHPDPDSKDIYDIDMYREIGTSWIIYLDKRKLLSYVTETDVLGTPVKIFKPCAELVVHIAHAVIPEQIFTLFVYYATLYHLLAWDPGKSAVFTEIARENHVMLPVRCHLSLTAALHQAVYGFVPESMERLLGDIGHEAHQATDLASSEFEMPRRYDWSTLIRCLAEKAMDSQFRRSAVSQAMGMLNPRSFRYTRFIFRDILHRRRRETY